MVINKNIISYRCQKWMPSWVDCVSAVFPGGRSHFIRSLLLRMALEQDPQAKGVSRLFHKETPPELPTGDTYPFHVRVDDATILLIKDAAAERGQTVGEWAATATYKWQRRFKAYQDNKELKEGIDRKAWLPGYVQLFVENCNKAPTVYALKRGHLPILVVSDTLVLQGVDKSVAIPVAATTK